MRVDLEKSIWMGGEKIDERECLGCEKYIIEGGEDDRCFLLSGAPGCIAAIYKNKLRFAPLFEWFVRFEIIYDWVWRRAMSVLGLLNS